MKLSLLNLRTHSNIQTQKNNITKPQVVQIQDNEIQNHNLLNEINAASMNSRYITQSSLKEIASSNVNGQKVYQNFRSKYISTVQRAVPRYNNEHPHAVAETGSYKARGGHDVLFSSKSHPRSRFAFGEYTRNEVLARYPHSKIGNRIVSVQDQQSGQMVNVEGIHLDHMISWDTIASIMNNDRNYTFYEAKKYYNDQTNLHPVLGGLNSSAGVSGVAALGQTYPEINNQITRIQTSWMNLQNYITAKWQETGGTDIKGLISFLSNIESQLNSGLEY